MCVEVEVRQQVSSGLLAKAMLLLLLMVMAMMMMAVMVIPR